MQGKLIKIPDDHKGDIITLNKEYPLMPSVNDKNVWVIASDDGLNYIKLNKGCFAVVKDKKTNKKRK